MRTRFAAITASVLATLMVGTLGSGELLAAGEPAPNSQPNPYHRSDHFLKLPAGRSMGSSSAVAVDHAGHLWIAERCGANTCAGSTIDPIVEFDANGNFIKAFGHGMLLFPHGFFIDREDHIWVTDGHVADGKGYDVLEFDQSGKLLRTLGKSGVAGTGPDTFHEPNAVLVAPNGDIFVADGHDPGGSSYRVVKFDKNGAFIKQWGGKPGTGDGQFDCPHTLAMDSKGRLFVGDRANNRIQIFDQEGKFLASWTQFSRPSGIYIDSHDVLYVSDSESRDAEGYGHHPGWKRGVRVGSAKDGVVTAFMPDPGADPEHQSTSGGEGITADTHGTIYLAQVDPRDIAKFEKQ
jgi:DNA-binding beta-propeller fold protein YncE